MDDVTVSITLAALKIVTTIFGQSIKHFGLVSLMHGPDVFLPLNLTEQLN